MSIEAMKQALEAFEDIASWYDHDRSVGSLADSMYEAKCLATVQATSLRQAIEQAEKQEPVAYINVEQRKLEWAKYIKWDTPTVVNLPKISLYTTPQPQQAEKQGSVAWQRTCATCRYNTHSNGKFWCNSCGGPTLSEWVPIKATPPTALVQEPVAWMTINAYGEEDDIHYENPEGHLPEGWTYKPLYTRPQPAAQMRMPKIGDRVICIEDESLATVESLTGGGSPDIKFDDGSHGTYLLREFAELFRYADTTPQPQREWVEVECPLCGEMAVAYTHPNLNKEKNT